MLVMVEVVLVLGQTTYPPRNLILEQTFMMGFLGHLIVITQHTLWCQLGVGVIQFVLLLDIYSVLQLVVLEVILDLRPPIFPQKDHPHPVPPRTKEPSDMVW